MKSDPAAWFTYRLPWPVATSSATKGTNIHCSTNIVFVVFATPTTRSITIVSGALPRDKKILRRLSQRLHFTI